MFIHERHHQIAQIIETNGRASVAELAARFGVSEVTIRKDLAHLEAAQRVTRVHGGALVAPQAAGLALSGRSEPAFQLRERLHEGEKSAIGRAAAALVKDGESIALDASTTALHVARHLRDRRELTIITNGLRIATELIGVPGITVLMPGGRLRWEAYSLAGPWGRPLFDAVNIERAFVGAFGLTLETGLTDAAADEAEAKRAMINAAREVIAVVDHSKWGRVAFATFCPLDRVNLVITDSGAPRDMVSAVRAAGVTVTVIDPGASAAPSRRARPVGRPKE